MIPPTISIFPIIATMTVLPATPVILVALLYKFSAFLPDQISLIRLRFAVNLHGPVLIAAAVVTPFVFVIVRHRQHGQQ